MGNIKKKYQVKDSLSEWLGIYVNGMWISQPGIEITFPDPVQNYFDKHGFEPNTLVDRDLITSHEDISFKERLIEKNREVQKVSYLSKRI